MNTENVDEPCPLCQPFSQLSTRPLAAMNELESGGGIRWFDTVDELFEYLNNDSNIAENELLIKFLPALIERASKQSPSTDWCQELNEI